MTQEVGMITGVRTTVGDANFRYNLTSLLVMTCEYHQKFKHFCTEKVMLTRFLFRDDVSKCVEQIEDSVMFKFTFNAKKPPFTWCLSDSRTRGFRNTAVVRGFYSWSFPLGFGCLPSGVLNGPPMCYTMQTHNMAGAGAVS